MAEHAGTSCSAVASLHLMSSQGAAVSSRSVEGPIGGCLEGGCFALCSAVESAATQQR